MTIARDSYVFHILYVYYFLYYVISFKLLHGFIFDLYKLRPTALPVFGVIKVQEHPQVAFQGGS